MKNKRRLMTLYRNSPIASRSGEIDEAFKVNTIVETKLIEEKC